MRRLIFTDVHASLPALTAVLHDAGHWDEALFLGDIVGFGPHPAECTALLREINPLRILGNHDYDCCTKRPKSLKSLWDAWTYARLSDDMRRWVLDCPGARSLHFGDLRVLCSHRAPSAIGYLLPSVSAEKMAAAFGDTDADLLLCGHYHHGIERVHEGKRYAAIRAVGQMRDGDPQAGYTIEEDGELTHHRVPYDIERVVYDLGAIGLEEAFRARWASFIRTAHDPEWSRL